MTKLLSGGKRKSGASPMDIMACLVDGSIARAGKSPYVRDGWAYTICTGERLKRIIGEQEGKGMKPPEIIYLQVDPDGESEAEVTWCVDQINDSDARYRLDRDRMSEDEIWRAITELSRKSADIKQYFVAAMLAFVAGAISDNIEEEMSEHMQLLVEKRQLEREFFSSAQGEQDANNTVL